VRVLEGRAVPTALIFARAGLPLYARGGIEVFRIDSHFLLADAVILGDFQAIPAILTAKIGFTRRGKGSNLGNTGKLCPLPNTLKVKL